MKHLFGFIDKVMILLNFVPRSISTEEDMKKAKKIIILIEEYTTIIRKLVKNHKIKKYLKALQEAHKTDITQWVEHITQVFSNLDKLLEILDSDIIKLKRILKDEPQKWQSTVQDLALGMVMTGLHDEEEKMTRLRAIALVQINDIAEIISHKAHTERLKKWHLIQTLDEDEKILQCQQFFAKLLH